MSAQKINVSRLELFEIIIALFKIDDKDKKSHFFEKTFLLTNIGINIAFKMLFLILNNVELNFNDRQLI